MLQIIRTRALASFQNGIFGKQLEYATHTQRVEFLQVLLSSPAMQVAKRLVHTRTEASNWGRRFVQNTELSQIKTAGRSNAGIVVERNRTTKTQFLSRFAWTLRGASDSEQSTVHNRDGHSAVSVSNLERMNIKTHIAHTHTQRTNERMNENKLYFYRSAVQPKCLGGLVTYFAQSSSDESHDEHSTQRHHAYLYAFGIVCCSFFSIVCSEPFTWICFDWGMRVRAACCSLIYRKVVCFQYIRAFGSIESERVNDLYVLCL